VFEKRRRDLPSGLIHCARMQDRPQHYPSDTSDEQWAIIEPLLPSARTGGRPEKHPRRLRTFRRNRPAAATRPARRPCPRIRGGRM